jgi:hypothetical protein
MLMVKTKSLICKKASIITLKEKIHDPKQVMELEKEKFEKFENDIK